MEEKSDVCKALFLEKSSIKEVSISLNEKVHVSNFMTQKLQKCKLCMEPFFENLNWNFEKTEIYKKMF